MIKRFWGWSLVIGSLIIAAGCDTVDPEDQPVGEFIATVEGDITGTIVGPATAGKGTDADTGEIGYAINMTQVGTGSHITLFRWGSVPEVGSYEMGQLHEVGGDPAEEQFAAEILLVDPSLSVALASDSGMVEITEVTAESISGMFEIVSSGQLTDQFGQPHPIEVGVSGEFLALREDPEAET